VALRELILCENDALTDANLAVLTGLHGLRALSLRASDSLSEARSGVTDAGVALLSVLPYLQDLSVVNYAVSGTGMATLTALRSLVLEHSATDDGVAAFTALTALRDLRLVGCPAVTGTGISALTRLESLSLEDCRGVTDEDVASLSALIELRSLTLSGTNLTGTCLSSLTTLSRLQHLWAKNWDEPHDYDALQTGLGLLTTSLPVLVLHVAPLIVVHNWDGLHVFHSDMFYDQYGVEVMGPEDCLDSPPDPGSPSFNFTDAGPDQLFGP
jgi:hypothetical protein